MENRQKLENGKQSETSTIGQIGINWQPDQTKQMQLLIETISIEDCKNITRLTKNRAIATYNETRIRKDEGKMKVVVRSHQRE